MFMSLIFLGVVVVCCCCCFVVFVVFFLFVCFSYSFYFVDFPIYSRPPSLIFLFFHSLRLLVCYKQKNKTKNHGNIFILSSLNISPHKVLVLVRV